MRRRIGLFAGIVALLLLTTMGSVFAQGGDVAYGTSVIEGYSGTPVVYTFTGNENDVATVYVIGQAGLQPTIALARSNGQPLAFNAGDSLTPVSGDARITLALPATDTYIITVGSQGGTTGSYLFSLSGIPLTPIPLDANLTVTIAPDGASQQFSLSGASSTTLSLQATEGSGFYTARIHQPDGSIYVVIVGGEDATGITLPATDGDYILVVEALEAVIGAEVILSLDGAPVDSTTTDTTATDTTDTTTTTDPNACTITASGVNVRSGPGTNYDIIGSLIDGGQIIATGQYNGWYTGNFNGQSAWVAASVVTATGACANLQQVAPPPAPQPQQPPPPAATEEANTGTGGDTGGEQDNTGTGDNNNTGGQDQPVVQPTNTPPPPPTEVPFVVVSMSCIYQINNGVNVSYRVEGPPNAQFVIEARQGSTVYDLPRTMNAQGFRTGNDTIAGPGNNNYTAYIVYNGVDIRSAEC